MKKASESLSTNSTQSTQKPTIEPTYFKDFACFFFIDWIYRPAFVNIKRIAPLKWNNYLHLNWQVSLFVMALFMVKTLIRVHIHETKNRIGSIKLSSEISRVDMFRIRYAIWRTAVKPAWNAWWNGNQPEREREIGGDVSVSSWAE